MAKVYVPTLALYGYRLCRTGDDLMACQLPMPQANETGEWTELDDDMGYWTPGGLTRYVDRVAAEWWYDRRTDTYGIIRRAA